LASLTVDNLTEGAEQAAEPFALFAAWLAAAEKSEPNDPNAMSLATVDAEGVPNIRMVLVKAATADGFTFYTHRDSAKGLELAAHPSAAGLFHWKSLRRQIRIRGRVDMATEAEADAYFRTRHPRSQIGAWASQQSRPLASRAALEAVFASYEAKFASGEVPRPPHWVGYKLSPLAMEFWSDGAFRLHDRISFRRAALGAPWEKERLFP
jgi:pyridoxamine 5'-phosphate oxidase